MNNKDYTTEVVFGVCIALIKTCFRNYEITEEKSLMSKWVEQVFQGHEV